MHFRIGRTVIASMPDLCFKVIQHKALHKDDAAKKLSAILYFD
jgi:hypothetical protein